MISNNNKGNPNHDENGRFTSDGNASAGKRNNTYKQNSFEDKMAKMGFGENKEKPNFPSIKFNGLTSDEQQAQGIGTDEEGFAVEDKPSSQMLFAARTIGQTNADEDGVIKIKDVPSLGVEDTDFAIGEGKFSPNAMAKNFNMFSDHAEFELDADGTGEWQNYVYDPENKAGHGKFYNKDLYEKQNKSEKQTSDPLMDLMNSLMKGYK